MTAHHLAASDDAAGPPAEPGGRTGWVRRLLGNPLAAACLVFLAAAILFGLSSPWLAPHPADATQLDAVNAPPFTPGHLLGGDGSGRDILSRLMWGTQRTLFSCVIMLVSALVVGVPAGLLAGYRRGVADSLINWVSDLVMTLPGIVLLIALYTLTGPNLVAAMGVFGVLVAPSYFRIVRGVVLGVRNELYVDAAKVVGLSDARIIGRHVLWAVRAPVVIQSSFVLGAGIAIQAAVDFLGLGDPSKASWGAMLQEAFANIYTNPWSVVWPASLISLTGLVLVLLGNALRDALQVGAARTTPTRRQRERLAAAFAVRADDEPARPAADQGALLSVRGLRVAYPSAEGGTAEVVRGVDLDVRRGEIRGLVGESGSGKTQTAFSVLGILGREALVGGSAVFDGDDLIADPATRARVRGRRIAYVPQEPMSNLDPCFTVGSQLVHGLRAVRRIDRQEARREVLALLARVGIKDPAHVFNLYPHQISGGMAQRVLICGAVAADPDLIIADEPTTALDVTVQAEVLDLLRELRDERGLGMVLVTHNFGVVADLCDTVSVMKDGRIVESGDVRTVFRAPHHPYTKELLSSTRVVDLGEVATDG
ncbi:dipeptide/oligopeptide/nickel ABC transporter permease/ATP-binding protein [Kitasatospora sp. YST-16]|uniref:dipeptide/oligopeptide/nickel ABC transporter permease/ATP-binding protein n=1 Tax=Kitasatospora sp. YST-16 TaxID=2998080 RepID=UPI0022847290|nr:dipeptide/oligopeptide/nickel ABC transporter permease/ATP-binding protein [Kitasatospora sp. YST-16]WAL74670.1 dipeptide/oligopeptide/nickel ABC transporter permease/ATP-binding protein [Kitasatospora sp. YST-16]WNW40725.1 dipeptide/oligopeptide/nickel ABC transporter permease/ATP-binding protein [Streptomyces sp. Li-HN-5-13]